MTETPTKDSLAELIGELKSRSKPFQVPVNPDGADAVAYIKAQDERIKALEAGLKPFADAFLKKRTEYAKRYGADVEIGFKNFDKMPDKWEMDGITFSMGTFRTAASLLEAKP